MRFYPTSVAEPYAEHFDALAAEVNALAGKDVLGRGEMGLIESVDGKAIGDEKTRGFCERDAFSGFARVVLVKEPPAVWAKVLLTHEVGHAIGLDHSERAGHLMTESAQRECIGREAACLVEAMREAGAL